MDPGNHERNHKMNRKAKQLAEIRKAIFGAKDCLDGVASEGGYEELDRFAGDGVSLIARLGRALAHVDALATSLAAAPKPRKAAKG